MRLGLMKWPRRLKVPSPHAGWKRKIKSGLQSGMKYAAAGATLSAGAEGVSALVNMNRAPEMGEESQMVTLEDWGPKLPCGYGGGNNGPKV